MSSCTSSWASARLSGEPQLFSSSHRPFIWLLPHVKGHRTETVGRPGLRGVWGGEGALKFKAKALICSALGQLISPPSSQQREPVSSCSCVAEAWQGHVLAMRKDRVAEAGLEVGAGGRSTETKCVCSHTQIHGPPGGRHLTRTPSVLNW